MSYGLLDFVFDAADVLTGLDKLIDGSDTALPQKKTDGSAVTAENAAIKQAAANICVGRLVAFPTETVYGLGADAFNALAVARIYSAKGRPADNPLILHVASIEKFKELAHNPSEYAFALAYAFWPGPLTLVARKNPSLPAWFGAHPQGTTETIGIRIPAHPVARALIAESGRVIAAPSANKAGRPSPTTLAHVKEDFQNSGIMFLDGGSAACGLESTVVDITGESPVILRPGAVPAEEIHKIISMAHTNFMNHTEVAAPRSPGMKYKHYAPRAEMTVLSGAPENIASYIVQKSREDASRGIGAFISEKTRAFLSQPLHNIKYLPLGENEKTTAQNFFARLREFDKLEVDSIFAEAVPESGLGLAIMDRMLKASEGRVINV